VGKELNGPLIKSLRGAAGQRQEDLAALAGISDRSLRLAESGKKVGIDTVTRLAAALKLDPPDQLFAEKRLHLDQVRRVGDSNHASEMSPRQMGELSKGEEPITRVRLDRAGRRSLRRYVLNLITPISGFRLRKSGVCFHEEAIGGWNQSMYEGFLAACVFFLENGTFAYKEGACGNFYTFLKSLLMGRQGQKMLGTGDADGEECPRNRVLEEKVEKIWEESEIGPAGSLSEDLHRYCPPCEPDSFYRGWLECCYWLTGNASMNLEKEIEHDVDFYRTIVIGSRSYGGIGGIKRL
jgi:transcriptional regulator with XRE-family HTH domain